MCVCVCVFFCVFHSFINSSKLFTVGVCAGTHVLAAMATRKSAEVRVPNATATAAVGCCKKTDGRSRRCAVVCGVPDSTAAAKERSQIGQGLVAGMFLLLLAATGALVWVSANSRSQAIQIALTHRTDTKQAAMRVALETWGRLADKVGMSVGGTC